MTPVLLLWDIDGTLIRSGGVGERALVRATRETQGVDFDLRQLDWAGRTDRRIAEMILDQLGRPRTPEAVHALVEAYLDSLADEIGRSRGTVLPGVSEILEHVDASDRFFQGLLTGNMERGAEIKLGHYGLCRFFPFGAFADDASDRNELGPHAIRKAAAYHEMTFSAERTFIIGDTPHDIECGKVIGARTVAVATGTYPADALEAHRPDALFADLADVEAVLNVIEQG